MSGTVKHDSSKPPSFRRRTLQFWHHRQPRSVRFSHSLHHCFDVQSYLLGVSTAYLAQDPRCPHGLSLICCWLRFVRAPLIIGDRRATGHRGGNDYACDDAHPVLPRWADTSPMRPSTDRTAAAVQFPSRAVCMPTVGSSAAGSRSGTSRVRNSAMICASFDGPGRPGHGLHPASRYGPVSSVATRRAEVMPSMIAATSSVTSGARASRASCCSMCLVEAGFVACVVPAGLPWLTRSFPRSCGPAAQRTRARTSVPGWPHQSCSVKAPTCPASCRPSCGPRRDAWLYVPASRPLRPSP